MNIGASNGSLYLGQEVSINKSKNTVYAIGGFVVGHKAKMDGSTGNIFTNGGRISAKNSSGVGQAYLDGSDGHIFTKGSINVANKIKINDSSDGNITFKNGADHGIKMGNALLSI